MKRKLRKRERIAGKTYEVSMDSLAGDKPKGVTKNELKKILRRAANKAN